MAVNDATGPGDGQKGRAGTTRRAISRLPIELLLTVAFAVVMAVVLAATGVLIHTLLANRLDMSIDRALQTRVDDLATLVRADGVDSEESRNDLASNDDSFAQVLAPDRRVLAASPSVDSQPLLSPGENEQALRGPIEFQRTLPAPVAEHVRIRTAPVSAEDGTLIVLAGSSLESRDEALTSLTVLLVIGGAIALLLASFAGLGVATAALRPVEAMRREAARVALSSPGRRLPVPPGRDKLARLGVTLNEMLARQERAYERERAFVSDASHELRTPLATLKTELEVALLEQGTREQAFASLALAAEETDRLAQLAEDLLVIARADQGRLPITPKPVAVTDVFAELEASVHRRATESGRRLVKDAPPELIVIADRLRLEQALGNLLDNALYHGRGTVTLSAIRAGDHAELHVRDEGPGFPADFLPHAFERFARADAARSDDGSGLGLAIVDVIARAHGGSAHAANLPSGGADTWIELPAG